MILSASGRYFKQSDKESKSRCEDECEEVYFTFFTYGACVSDIYGRLPKNAQPPCNLRCGIRIRNLASIGIFLTFAAALATLIFTLPLCITTCASCLNARKSTFRHLLDEQTVRNVDIPALQRFLFRAVVVVCKANKTAKRVFIEAHNQPYKEQQLQTLPYNPYAYWPYYGRA
uniref:Uncharacterized protein n=1 Tax=Setaria digitata TaxID=48799 RepID=A0A915Q7Y7_9BILA